MRTRDIRSVIYLGAGLGLIVSIYTYLETVQSSLQKYCTVNSYVSCGAVANSGKTTVLGIPDSFIGIGGFVLVILVAAIAERRRRDLLWPELLLALTTRGVAFSIYFLYVELVEIQALCPVCLTAWVFGWIVWLASIALFQKVRAKARSRTPEKTRSSPAPDPSSTPAAKS